MEYNNSEYHNIVNTLYVYVSTISVCAIMIFLFLLMLVSFIWTIYLILKQIKESKHLKYLNKIRNSIPKDSWLSKVKNSERKSVKYKFLLAICVTEWIFGIFVLISGVSTDYHYIREDTAYQIPKIYNNNNLFSIIQASVYHKLAWSFMLIIILILLMLVRSLTRYLRQQYSFYKDKSSDFRTALKYKLPLIFFIFLLGLFPQTIVIQWILYFGSFSYELVCYTKECKKLCNLLYNRYFDAKTHEYQSKYIVRFYRGVYLEFKIGSCMLIMSFFLQLISSMSMSILYSVRLMLISPNNWLQILFMKGKIDNSLSAYQLQEVDLFSKSYTMVQLFLLSMSEGLLVIPYVIVSVKILCTAIKSYFNQNRDYENHDLIRRLIDNNNRAY